MNKKLGRNAPCWCNSGIKYKRCHLDREGQVRENSWANVDINKKEFRKKKCCAQGNKLGACDGGVIKAHTVSRGPSLSRIARKGRVVRYSADIPEMNKNGGKLVASEVGIKNASVFHGFCAEHDRKLFSCIENEAFKGRPDQCLAVAYRTLSRELYGKDAASHLRETLRGADKGESAFDQILHQQMLEIVDAGNEAARKDLGATHAQLTDALSDGQADLLCSLIFELDGELPFMLAGAWSPFTDYLGKELQNGYARELWQQVFLSSFLGVGTSYLCVSWINKAGAPGRIIADQIRGLPNEKLAEGFLQFATKHIENIFYSPEWFEELSFEQKSQLDLLAASGIDSLGSPPDASINSDSDLDFDLPCAVRSFYSGADCEQTS